MSSADGHPFWKNRALWTTAVWVAIVAVVVLGTRFYTPGTEPKSEAVADENVVADPVAFAQEIYVEKVVPTITDEAVDLVTLLEAIDEDPDAAGAEFGHRNGDSPYSYPVRVTGIIAEGKFGEAALEVEGMGDATVGVQTGPAVSGTSVRDATGLVSFDMFLNQIDFAAVATEINNQIKSTVLADTDFEALMGEEVTVIGAITYNDATHIRTTPIKIETTS